MKTAAEMLQTAQQMQSAEAQNLARQTTAQRPITAGPGTALFRPNESKPFYTVPTTSSTERAPTRIELLYKMATLEQIPEAQRTPEAQREYQVLQDVYNKLQTPATPAQPPNLQREEVLVQRPGATKATPELALIDPSPSPTGPRVRSLTGEDITAFVQGPAQNTSNLRYIAGYGFVDPKTADLVRELAVPTSTTRTMQEAAPKVMNLADTVLRQTQEQTARLGPLRSRWNEFIAGQVGAPNPEFTQLRTNVALLTTLLLRMHVGARGGEQMMQHFKDLMDVSIQSPENLEAAVREVRAYAESVGKSSITDSGVAGTSEGSMSPAVQAIIEGLRNAAQ
jgi:hypothetical protein